MTEAPLLPQPSPEQPAEGPPARPDQNVEKTVARDLHLALRTIRTHDWSNGVCLESMRRVASSFNQATASLGPWGIHVFGDHLYVGDTRLRYDRGSFRWTERLRQDFDARGIGGIVVRDRVEADQVESLLRLLKEHPAGGEEAFLAIQRGLSELQTVFILEPPCPCEGPAGTGARDITRKERCKKTFFRAVTVAEGLMESLHLGEKLQLRTTKRVVQQMVDLMIDEEFTFLGLTTLKTYDNYTYYHSVNVAIYAIALGKRLGLTRLQLAELGTAALLHDVGKVRIPKEVLKKEGVLTNEERATVERHPLTGAKEVIRTAGLSPLSLRVLTGCLEHHMNFDGSGGYPGLGRSHRPRLISRIIAIADCFDALTTKRVYRTHAMSRDKALSYMISRSGSTFDPLLMRLFANLLGVYPIGTAVRLRSGRMAVVVAASEDPTFCDRPVVRPITNEQGFQLSGVSHPEVDLSARNAEGEYPDEIVLALDAPAMGMDVTPFFL